MGSRGDGYDNAVAETFFAMLKKELVDRRSWLGDRFRAGRIVASLCLALYGPRSPDVGWPDGSLSASSRSRLFRSAMKCPLSAPNAHACDRA